jgi:3-oxoacyl-[acyl-carrier protein] reductase
MELKDLKIIVTGAARGMGHNVANQLASAGAKGCDGDVDEAGLAAHPEPV